MPSLITPSNTAIEAHGIGARAYGAEAAYLVRPDGHIGWRGAPENMAGLAVHPDRILLAVDPPPR